MKRTVLAILLVFTAILFLRAQDAEREIRQIEEQLVQATLKNDATAFDRILASDYTTTNAYGLVRTKAEVINDIKSGTTKPPTALELKNIKVRVYGDAAILTADRSTKGGVTRGKPGVPESRGIRVYIKRQGRWQPVALQISPIAP